jgi:hypothetical protein
MALLMLWAAPLLAQEQELLKTQAGRYPVRAYLTSPAAVGPARIVVELGPPTVISATPRTRPIQIGSPPDSPYAPDAATSSKAAPDASAFEGVEVAVAADMPDMPGTKAVEVRLASTNIPGRFEGDLLLTMRGDWRILFLVTTPTGVTRKPVNLTVGAPSGSAKKSDREGLELCSPDGGDDVPVTIHCLPDPPRVGPNELRLVLPDAATVPVMVGVDMPGMAVGIPPTEAVRHDDGSYRATISLPMAGYWQLRVDLNGRALPPFALNVDEPESAGRSLSLLLWLGLALVLLVIWVRLKRPKALWPVALSGGILLCALALGALMERREVADHSGGMSMEMMAADMGLGHLTAPLPVLKTRVEKSPFVISRNYPGTIVAANETPIVSPRTGPLTRIVSTGTAVEAGQTLALVGQAAVRAPFRGVVVRALQAVGDQVAQGAPLLVVTDTSKIAIRARAPEADRALLTVGMKVQVADSGRQIARGNLTSIAALSQAGTFETEAVVEGRRQQSASYGHDGSLLAPASWRDIFFIGQEVVLQVEMDRLPASISVPKTAVRRSADGTQWVFVIEQVAGRSVARSRKVTLGQVNETLVQVLAGLEQGKTIVANAESSLRDGDIVVAATLGEGVFRSLYVPSRASH